MSTQKSDGQTDPSDGAAAERCSAQRSVDRKTQRAGELLDAAEKVFGRSDYHEATIDEVAEAAGVTKGTVYLYFDNKLDLFLSTIERKLSQLHDVIVHVTTQASDPVEAIRAVIRAELAFFAEHTDFFRVIYAQRSNFELRQESKCDEIRVRWLRLLDANVDVIATHIEAGQRQGVFQSLGGREAARALAALVHNCVYLHIVDQNDDLVGKAAILEQVFLQGLLSRD